jgi:hypothetical protein
VALEFDFISASDKPALLALSTPEYLAESQVTLTDLGYKVHLAENHEDFRVRFAEVHYQVVILEELFAASVPAENVTMANIQSMPMAVRRHATFLLIGLEFQTLNPFQAFQQSVQAVVHPAELTSLRQIIQKVVAENDLFLSIFRDAQFRLAQGKLT